MKKSLHYATCLIGLLVGSIAFSQSSNITIEASQNITNFVFKDSLGEKDENYAPNYSGGYALGYRYTLENGLFFSGKLGMRKGGATYVYDAINYSWEFQYSELRLGIGYSYPLGKFAVSLSASPYLGYLLKAQQRLNNEEYDILNTGVIERVDYGVFITPGASFQANEYIAVFANINTMFGFSDFETSETQISNNRLYGGTLGLSFTIK